jgi:hypothetical protein
MPAADVADLPGGAADGNADGDERRQQEREAEVEQAEP